MEKLLLLGTCFGSVEFVEYAKKQGIYTIVTDNREPEKSKSKLVSDEYWMISTANLDELEKKCKEEEITAVFAGHNEFNLEMAMQLAKRLKLPWYCSEESWHYARNKADFKRVCRDVGVPVAEDYHLTDALTEEELSRVRFPVVVKPVDQCGNYGMSYCYNKEELKKAYRYARSVSDNETVIVERMLHGQEYYATYVMAEGEIRMLYMTAMNAQPGMPNNLYSIITTGTDQISHYMKEFNPAIIKAFKKIGCREGLAWVEVILDEDDQFYALEMAYRFGGDMIYGAVKDVVGFDAMKWMLDCVTGVKHSVEELPEQQSKAFKECVVSYEFFSNCKSTIIEIDGLEQLQQLPDVTVDFMRRPGDSVERHQIMGEITLKAENCMEMCGLIRKVNDTLKVKNENGENMAVYYTDYKGLMEMYKRGLAET